jgi:regulator of sigma E protease
LYLNLFALSWWLTPSNWPMILMGIFGLGLVIFVHELGHFLVAKMCGVKCEKFYIGFDINGLKLWKHKWGETEYGIGILPLGGYVKMLGQEDNPARVAEEMERAKQHPAAPGTPAAEQQAYTLDPRSYMAQSVPERMAIISAGVIMNVIFAFIFASIAYGMGVEYTPAVVGTAFPGQAGWLADLRPGDEIVQLGDIKQPRFEDLRQQVALGDIEHGVPLLVKREGVDKLLSITVMPERREDSYAPSIGVAAAGTLTLDDKNAVIPFTPAAEARPAFEPNDRITSVNGQKVADYADLHAIMAHSADKTLVFTVVRSPKKQAGSPADKQDPTELEISVAPNPMQVLGLSMRMGPVVAVRPNSPAAEAGFKAGDRIVSINGEAPGDPVTLPERLRRQAGESLTVAVERKGEKEPVTLTVEPADVPWFEISPVDDGPMSAPALGIAYAIDNVVEQVAEGSGAAKAGVKPGDEVTGAKLIPPKDLKLPEGISTPSEITITFDAEHRNWAQLHTVLQESLPGQTIELTLKDGRTVKLEPSASQEWFVPQRGIRLQNVSGTRTAASLGEALALGKRETVDALMMVVRFLKKIGTQVSPMALGGPLTIFQQAGVSAGQGISTLLIFLCMLSANLAVINFLPIPVLDGGHMVFLMLEGIRGKPVSERVFLAFTYLGFLFILMLMVFVLGLDVYRLF